MFGFELERAAGGADFGVVDAEGAVAALGLDMAGEQGVLLLAVADNHVCAGHQADIAFGSSDVGVVGFQTAFAHRAERHAGFAAEFGGGGADAQQVNAAGSHDAEVAVGGGGV